MVTHPIRIVRGDDWADLKVRWRLPDDGDTPGDVVAIVSARMQVRSSANSASVYLTLDTETEGGITIDGDDYAIPTITTEQSAGLRSGVWDLEVTSDGGQIKTLAGGPFIVKADVTRDDE